MERLVRRGLLVRDSLVEDVLSGRAAGVSARSAQRRFLQATGLSPGTVRRIERARRALTLLQSGVPIPDVVHLAGYFDQPHLTRSLQLLTGRTPAHPADPAPASSPPPPGGA